MFSLAKHSRISTICLQSLRQFHVSLTHCGKASTTPKKSEAKNDRKRKLKDVDSIEKPPERTGIRLHKSRIEEFLEELDTSREDGPSLDDLLDMKPAPPAGPGSATYAEEYENGLKRVLRAFKTGQMPKLVNKAGYTGERLPNSRDMAQFLIEKSWDWPPPHEVKRRLKESIEIVTEEVTVSPAILLLLIAENPHIFSDLSTQFSLKLSLGRSPQPTISAQGLRQGISELKEYLEVKIQQTVSTSMNIYTGRRVSSSLMQMVIRRAKAYVEVLSTGVLKITAFTDEALQRAERMIRRSLELIDYELAIPVIAQMPPPSAGGSTSEFAYYPFLPAKSVPYILEKRQLFRLKNVTNWLDDYDEQGSVTSEQPLVDLRGQPSLLFATSPSTITTTHRVIYRLSQPGDLQPVRQVSCEATPGDILLVEVKMEYDTSSRELDDLDGHDMPPEKIAILPLHGSHRCRTGVEASVDILLPERAMDMRLTVRDLREIDESDEPESIKSYLGLLLQFLQYQVDKQPMAPETIQYMGKTYVLQSSSSIRRAYETISQEDEWNTRGISSFGSIGVTAETALNLESQEKTSHCFVETVECRPENWQTFMAHCSDIASIPFTPQASDRAFHTPVFSE
ncbi:hypothetical protein FRC17_009321 [Serendipita sp. 399]|nr:hypothetical protein FRC17_009321 [Serendipita sp. 399]